MSGLPAGIEDYFATFGDRVPSRMSPAPELTEDERKERMETAVRLAPQYRMEVLQVTGLHDDGGVS